MKKVSLLSALVLAAGMSFAQTNWGIDAAHSNIGFTVSHMVISETEGNFKEFDATVTSSKEDFDGAAVVFTAKVASIDTDNQKRDEHLKGEDFFNAEKYPEIKFDGKIKKSGSKYQLVGDFTMRGVTKKVTFDVKYNGTVKDPWGNIKSGFKINGTVNRQEYGLKWGALTEAGGAVVGDEVNIICNVELQKKG
ncbi:YceI family protein [Fulvivirga ulvae]|uniref:YceI family protein n=1 Tax=Fulvivirga ulvae TaxID=2904245 RepID=UPI001F15EC1A|nr:YceI family protein [Fulvivirga ulvae]UII32387.1 YceI family protein [Fulvivirga ulvae]